MMSHGSKVSRGDVMSHAEVRESRVSEEMR